MLLNKEISLIVFQIDNEVFEQIGEIGQYTSLIWSDRYNGYSSFELWLPMNEDNVELVKEGHVIWTGGENAGVIENIKSMVDKDGKKSYDVKGRTLEKLLTERIVWGTFIGSGRASTIIYNLVDSQCINPPDKNRKIPWLVNAEDNQVGLEISQYQKTGGEVYESVHELATDSDIGFNILFDPLNKRLTFIVRKGDDKTEHNTEDNEPIVFSTELEDILTSTYYSNSQDLRTVALVQGEDSGENRKSVTVGKLDGKGFDRKELYVDARDLQSEIYNDDGTTTILTPKQYLDTLYQRGGARLADYSEVQTFEAQMRQYGDVQYEYGVDYIKGDKVTVIDLELNVRVDARITDVQEEVTGDTYIMVLTFGYAFPTILQKIKRMIQL